MMETALHLPQFRYPLLDLDSSLNEPAPVLNFVLPSLGLLAGSVGTINAPGAAGKSWLGLQLSAYLGCNLDTLGLGSNDGNRKVLILAAEDPEEVLVRRLHVLSQRMTLEQKSIFVSNVSIACCLGKAGDFMDGGKTTNEISAISGEYDLVVVDTLSKWHSGQENDRKDAAHVMRQLEKIASTGPAVIFLHHVGKSTDASQQQAGRGSSVWVDESRWVGYLKNVPYSEAKKFGIKDAELRNLVRFGVSKVNYAKAPPSILLQRGPHGELLSTSCFEGQTFSGSNLSTPVIRGGQDDGDF